MDHPLLKELILKAPGSYHHSIMVASLAEAAARDIGAHPILVRVGAYYHDIGKVKKPLYFIEKQDMRVGAQNITPWFQFFYIIANNFYNCQNRNNNNHAGYLPDSSRNNYP